MYNLIKYPVFIFLISVSMQTIIGAQNLYIKNGNYYDSGQGKFVKGEILIRDGRISEIGTTIKNNDNHESIDASGLYILPGLIDAHVHLFQSGGLYTRPDVIDLREIKPYEDEVEWLQENAEDLMRRYLACGITSIIDVGGPMANFELRYDILGRSDLPNYFMTGPLISTYQPTEFGEEDPPIIKVNTVSEARELVRNQAERKPDFIKIWYITLPQKSAESSYEIVKAAIEESHALKLKVAVHATELNTAKLAIHAGADILVHSVDDEIDDDFIKLLKDNNVTYIPTMMVHGKYIEALTDNYQAHPMDFKFANPTALQSVYHTKILNNNEDLEYYNKYKSIITNTFEKQKLTRESNLVEIEKNGINIATGTDAGNIGTQHASSYFIETQQMKDAGMTNKQIIRACTQGGAQAIGKDNQIGSIAENKMADLIIMQGNPLDDLDALQNIKYVIKNGMRYSPEDLVPSTPESLANHQLTAYNAGNIDEFLKPYADDVAVYDFPGQLSYRGKEKMREGYADFFAEYPNLHCRLINRIVEGNTVIDQEEISGVGESTFKAVAIYKIKEGKIKEVYFMQ